MIYYSHDRVQGKSTNFGDNAWTSKKVMYVENSKDVICNVYVHLIIHLHTLTPYTGSTVILLCNTACATHFRLEVSEIDKKESAMQPSFHLHLRRSDLPKAS